jgi:hypothetical protein
MESNAPPGGTTGCAVAVACAQPFVVRQMGVQVEIGRPCQDAEVVSATRSHAKYIAIRRGIGSTPVDCDVG